MSRDQRRDPARPEPSERGREWEETRSWEATGLFVPTGRHFAFSSGEGWRRGGC